VAKDDLPQFSKDIKRYGDSIPRIVNALMKAIAVSVTKEIVIGTPVDEGTARSNWRMGLGRGLRSVIAAHSPYPKGSKGGGAGRGETVNAAKTIAAAKTVIQRRLPGQTMVLSNSVPYIGDLNSGSSRQAPALFVEAGILGGLRKLDGKELKL